MKISSNRLIGIKVGSFDFSDTRWVAVMQSKLKLTKKKEKRIKDLIDCSGAKESQIMDVLSYSIASGIPVTLTRVKC